MWNYFGVNGLVDCCNEYVEKIRCARWSFNQDTQCQLLTLMSVRGQQPVITRRIVGWCPKGSFKGTVVRRTQWTPAWYSYSGPGPCGSGRGNVEGH